MSTKINIPKVIESFANSINEGIIISDNKTKKILFVNDKLLKKLGFEESEMLNIDLASIVSNCYTETVNEKLVNDENESYQVMLKSKNGKHIRYSVSGKIWEYEGTEYRVSTCFDLTLIYDYFEKLFLETRNSVIKDLLSNIGHHWRQILTIITLKSSSLLFDINFVTNKEEDIKKSLEVISKTSQDLSKMIDYFLDLDTSNKEVDEFSLEKLCESTFKLCQTELKIFNVTISKTYLSNDKVVLEKKSFTSAVYSILNNFLEIVEKKKIEKPEIELKISENDKNYILSISDNLGGIPGENLDRIFEPYFTTYHKKVGKGLGLYTAKKMLEINNSIISVENVNDGAKFTIKIPKEGIKKEQDGKILFFFNLTLS